MMGLWGVLKFFTPGFHAIAGFAKADMERVNKAEVAVLQLTKEVSQKRRAKRGRG